MSKFVAFFWLFQEKALLLPAAKKYYHDETTKDHQIYNQPRECCS